MSTTQQPAPPVARTIHGKLTGVEMRSAGWHRFSILEPGNQYPYRADTKKKDLIDQAMSLMNQDVSVEVQERQSETINEHTGEPFVNKYLNAIAAQGAQPGWVESDPAAQARNVEQSQPTTENRVQPGVSGFDKDITIWRQTAAKVVASSWQLLPESQRNPAGMVAACEAWVAYFVYGPARFGVQAFSGDGKPGWIESDPAAQTRNEQSEEEFIASLGNVEPVTYERLADGEPCKDCGFVGVHAMGCPQADFAA